MIPLLVSFSCLGAFYVHATIAFMQGSRLVSRTSHSTYSHSKPNPHHHTIHEHKFTCATTFTSLRGIDFDALEDDEECDFITNEIIPETRTKSVSSKSSAQTAVLTPASLKETTITRNPQCIELPTANADFSPEEVVNTCMNYLQNNDEPRPNSGLEVCFNFSSDSCRAAHGGNLESFLQYAKNPVFQTMVDCHEWEVLSVGPEIAGTNTRGAMKTVLVKVVQKKVEGARALKDRKFLWTLMKERRPPRQGYWLVHECISVENAFATTL